MYKLFFLLLVMNMAATTTAQKSGLRLLSYNIRNGKGMDNKTDLDRTAAVLNAAKADVIALQEVDSITKRSNGVNVLQVLAKKTGMQGVYGAAIPLQGGHYGVGVLAKQAPLRHYTIPLPGKEEARVLLVVEFKNYVVFCTHLSLTDADRMTSVNIINEQATLFTKPIYLLGDLNAEPRSNALTALTSTWTMLSGESPTFPAATPIKCIDFILSRNAPIKKNTTTTVIPEPLASDHRPVLVTIPKPGGKKSKEKKAKSYPKNRGLSG